MTNINELFQNYGITGIPAIDALILAHIIPLLVSYITLVFNFIKTFIVDLLSQKIETFYNNMKRRMLGKVDMCLCVSQDKSIYPIIRSILFSASVISDVTDQKTLGILNLITESKHNTSPRADYYNVYDLFLDSSNNITVEKKVDFGSAILKKYFKFNNYYIVVSENKKTEFKHYYYDGINKEKLDEKSEKETFILFEAIKASKNTIEDSDIIRKFLDERFKLNIRIPNKYIMKISSDMMAARLDSPGHSWKNSDSCAAELNISDGIDTFLMHPLVKDFYSYTNVPDKKNKHKIRGISSSLSIKNKSNSLDIENLEKDIIFTDTTPIVNTPNLFDPAFKSILAYFFGNRFNHEFLKGNYFYFRGNKIILYLRIKTDKGATERYICIVSFQEILNKNNIIQIFSDLFNPSTRIKPIDNDDITTIIINTHNGSKWVSTECDARSYNTIYLPKKTTDLIFSEMDKFVCYEKIYKEIGVPYKKGFLFYGPPGTGKTSSVKALAHKYNMPIYIIDVNNEAVNDDSIANILNSISGSGNRIVLFEDIDSAFAEKEIVKNQKRNLLKDKYTNDQNPKTDTDTSGKEKLKEKLKEKPEYPSRDIFPNRKYLTYSGLLNALDGVLTSQHGTIVIMTTNYKEKLGDALIRPGRIDFHIELTYCDRHQIIEMTSSMINKAYEIIKNVSESHTRKRMHTLIDKINFNNPYNKIELDEKINTFADNIMNKSFKKNNSNELSLIKPCELQVYILRYLNDVDNVFDNYEELFDMHNNS